MRVFLKMSGRWLTVGWFWAFVLIALPNCGLPECTPGVDCAEDLGGEGDGPTPPPPKVFDAGSTPSDAIFCDFPKPVPPSQNDCATNDTDLLSGISSSYAAVALYLGQNSSREIDWSDDATLACGGMPRMVDFLEGEYPHGDTVCINCGQKIGDQVDQYTSPTKACVAYCIDLLTFGGGYIPPEGAAEYCDVHAKPSTNTDPTICYTNGCTNGGNPNSAFHDPRTDQTPVGFGEHVGTSSFGTPDNNLRRDADTTGTGDADFNAGAASMQPITTGDGWVEFEAGENNMSHIIGLRPSCAPSGCGDADPGLAGIGFAISLNSDNNVYVLENVAGSLQVMGAYPPYVPGERFRVAVTDQHDGTALVSYYRGTASCLACPTDRFFVSESPRPAYPLKVDVTFREKDATLLNVTLVYLK